MKTVIAENILEVVDILNKQSESHIEWQYDEKECVLIEGDLSEEESIWWDYEEQNGVYTLCC